MTAITKDVVIADLLAENPDVGNVLVSMGMHCIGCPSTQHESLEMACYVHMLDVDEVVDCVNAYLEENAVV
ncbi:MAG: DUF1858 domain-containing protein [Lachnospiraceae bacterium]|nr:DUF1858 domain-containing protein [Lachnospiraceae bacterium]